MSDVLVAQKKTPARPKPLFEQLRRGRHAAGVSPEAIAVNQRERLFGAMIETVAERGYRGASVRHVSALAGVSTRTFYDRFGSMEGCFLATYDDFVEGAVRRIGKAYREERDWQARLCAAFAAFAAEVVASPKAARFVLVEVLAAGPSGVERLDNTRLTFEQLIASSLSAGADGVALPSVVVKGIVCGVERVTRRQLLSGRANELPALADELCRWMLAYRSAAVGELSAAAPRICVRPAPRQTSDIPIDRIRILHAAATIAAEEGYANLTAGRIACDAGVSQATFDALFEQGVEQCFLEAFNRMTLEALVYAAEHSKRAGDRVAGVRDGLAALLDYLACDPVLVQIAFVEVFRAGPAAIERREWLMRQFKELLTRSLPASGCDSEVAVEASIGAIWGVIHHQVAHGSISLLPGLANYLTYLALAPAIGAEAAVEAVVAGR